MVTGMQEVHPQATALGPVNTLGAISTFCHCASLLPIQCLNKFRMWFRPQYLLNKFADNLGMYVRRADERLLRRKETTGLWAGEKVKEGSGQRKKGSNLLFFLQPVFPGLFEFCSRYTGASLQGATQLNSKVAVPQSTCFPSCGSLNPRP